MLLSTFKSTSEWKLLIAHLFLIRTICNYTYTGIWFAVLSWCNKPSLVALSGCTHCPYYPVPGCTQWMYSLPVPTRPCTQRPYSMPVLPCPWLYQSPDHQQPIPGWLVELTEVLQENRFLEPDPGEHGLLKKLARRNLVICWNWNILSRSPKEK